MSITIRSAQTIRNGVRLTGNNPIPPSPSLPPLILDFDSLHYDVTATWADQSGLGNNMTLQNVGYVPSTHSLVWNGTSSYATIAKNSSMDLADNFALALWVNFTSTTSNSDPEMVNYNGWAFRWDGQVLGGFGYPGQLNLVKYFVADQQVPVSLTPGNWYHIVASQSPTEVTYYVNGASIGSYANSTPPQGSSSPMYIGGNGSGHFEPMSIQQFQMYNRALVVGEVTRLFNQDKARYGL